tara:strand:- start:280 stop:738 length:459 start_codon:yes stop_codon:yes gene_type:complete
MLRKTYLVKHTKGAIGLRLFGLGPNLKPCNGLFKLKKFLDRNAFWAQNREISEIKKCLANSDVIVSIWCCNQIVGFGRALSDGIYRGVLWDVVIDQNYQGQGYGRLIIETLLSSKEIKNTKKIYLMTTNQKSFYSQLDFKEATSQSLLIRDM